MRRSNECWNRSLNRLGLACRHTRLPTLGITCHWERSRQLRSVAAARLWCSTPSRGRAESWIDAELSDRSVELPIGPTAPDEPNPIAVFCPDPGTVFSDTYYPILDPGKLASGKVNPTQFLFDCPRWHLCLDTETIHAQRWPEVPGAKWVSYTRANETVASAPTRPARSHPAPIIARFMLDGPVLPLATDTLGIGELFRRAMMHRFELWCERNPGESASFRRLEGNGYASPILSGKDGLGNALHGHGHAHFLPTAEGDDPRRITHVTVYAPNCLGKAELVHCHSSKLG